jgi:hypothetical protein
VNRLLMAAVLSIAALPAAVEDTIAIGTESRQDDLPSVAAASNGTVWSAEVRATNRAANDCQPVIAIDGGGSAWVACD